MKTRQTSRLGAWVLALAALVALSAGAPAAQAGPTAAPDNSLTVKEYVDAGVPPIDKAWTPEDYKKAGTALEAIAKGDVTKLPRFNSKNSGELFAHITSQKNLELFGDKTVPVETRAEKTRTIVSYLPVFVVYANAIKPDQTFDAETLELGGFILRAELAAAQVITELKAAHNIVDDNEGFKATRAGYAQTVGGVLEFMMDHANIRTSETVRFIAKLKEFLPQAGGGTGAGGARRSSRLN